MVWGEQGQDEQPRIVWLTAHHFLRWLDEEKQQTKHETPTRVQNAMHMFEHQKHRPGMLRSRKESNTLEGVGKKLKLFETTEFGALQQGS
jgi:hypothetical protein